MFEGVGLVTGEAEGDTGLLALAVATFFAFVVGYASIALLLRFLVTHTTTVFVVYRVGLGIAVLAFAATGVIA